MCSYFDEVVLQKILHSTQPDVIFNSDLWHWIVDLEVTKNLPIGDDLYQIKPHYRDLFQRYINKRSGRYELVKIFEEREKEETDPRYISLYRAEKIIQRACYNHSDVSIETITDILSIFRYEKSVSREILLTLSNRLPNKKVYWIYKARGSNTYANKY